MIKIHVSLNINQPRCPFQLESSYAKPDCSGTETCRKLLKQKQPKMVKGKKQRCHAEASCDVTHGVPECSCNIGFTGDGVKNCKRRLQAFCTSYFYCKKILKYMHVLLFCAHIYYLYDKNGNMFR